MREFDDQEREPIKQVVGLLIIIAFSSLVIAGDKAIGVAGSAFQTTSAGGQKWALIVGINEYSNVPTIDFAHQDAVALKGSLIKAGFPADNIMLMTDTAKGAMYPTRGNLRADDPAPRYDLRRGRSRGCSREHRCHRGCRSRRRRRSTSLDVRRQPADGGGDEGGTNGRELGVLRLVGT